MLKQLIIIAILSISFITSTFAVENQSSLSDSKQQTIIESNDINSLSAHVDKETLVVFDIDYTLIRTTNHLGTSEWFNRLIQLEMDQGKSERRSYQKWYPAFERAQKYSDVTLMEKNLPALLKKIEQNSAGIIALTHRNPESSGKTFSQLNRFGIHFDSFSNIEFRSKKTTALFKNGVLFANNFNDKGNIFKEWLNQILPKINSMKKIKKVIFIDDLRNNVASMQKATKQIGLEYVGIRYSAGDAHKRSFDPTLIKKQAKILLRHLPEQEIRRRLEHLDNIKA